MARKLDRSDDHEPVASDERGPPRRRRGRLGLGRRSFLALGVAGALSSTGLGGARGSTVRRGCIDFRRTLDAVADLGMDSTGTDPIDDQLADTADGDLIQFPAGQYRFDAEFSERFSTDETRGFEGVGDDVRLLPGSETTEFLLDARDMTGFYLAGVTVDRHPTAGRLGVRLSGGRTVLRDLAVGDSRPFSPGPPETTEEGPDRLTIDGDAGADYEITVDGGIRSEDAAVGYGPSGAHAEGVVGATPTTLRVDGVVTDVRCGDGATLLWNGERISPAALGRGYPHRLVLRGEETACTFSADRLSPRAPRTGAKSQVAVGPADPVDRYRFGGAVESLDVRGSVTLVFGAVDH